MTLNTFKLHGEIQPKDYTIHAMGIDLHAAQPQDKFELTIIENQELQDLLAQEKG